MIICVAGPTGVGKTDSSWALIEVGSPMVLLDCDWFAARVPFSWKSGSDVESVYQAISVLLGYHIQRGVTRFVIPLTVEMALTFKTNQRYFAQLGQAISLLQLRCEEEVLRQRILQRDRLPTQIAAELDSIRVQQVQMAALSAEFQVIDTTHLDERATATKIWAAANGIESASAA
jgi:hypothetical protein